MIPQDAVVERLEDRALLAPHTLTTGPTTTDGNLSVGVDGYGGFGGASGIDTDNADYNPIGSIDVAGTTFQSAIAIRFGSSGTRTWLASGGPGSLANPTVTGTSIQGNSTFSNNGLNFVLQQSVFALSSAGQRTGSVLRQEYRITNAATTAQNFEILRYIDGDLQFDSSIADGGGRFVTSRGTEFLFETDSGGNPTTSTTFVGITTSGGTAPTSGRYEVASYSGLRSRIGSGTALANTIAQDSTNDGFVDAGSEYDVTLALRNVFSLAPGASAIYSTTTVFGTGAPSNISVPPIVSMSGATPVYTEDGAPVLIDPAATVDGQGTTDFRTGSLVVTIGNNADALDVLGIQNIGTGPNQIGVSGNTVTYGGTAIGTFTAGSGTSPLTVVLNAAATPEATQALLRAVTFSTTSQNPAEVQRTLIVTLNDGQGQSSNPVNTFVDVVATNDGPTVAFSRATASYRLGGPPAILDPNPIVNDVDSLNFNTGSLVVSVVTNGDAGDTLEIANVGTGAGQISLSGSNVLWGGVIIGTFSGGTAGTQLVVTFNASATLAAVQSLVANLTYRTVNTFGLNDPHVIEIRLTDDQAATSNPATITIPVNPGPTLTLSRQFTPYLEGGLAVVVDPNATVTDPNALNFNNGSLTVTSNGPAGDILEISNDGTNPGQIGISGTSVLFGGTAIGTFSGGTNSVALVVLFNSNASPIAVQALVRAVTFRSTDSSGSIALRTLEFVVSNDEQRKSETGSINIIVPAVQVYRSYDVNSKFHFFTTSAFEFQNTVQLGWHDESTGRPGFSIFDSDGGGRVPLFRMYSPPGVISRATGRGNQYHYLTASVGERDFLVSQRWTFESIEGYIYPFQADGTTDVFRLYNNLTGEHLFTAFASERDAILASFPGIWSLHSNLGFAFPGSLNFPSSSVVEAGASASAVISSSVVSPEASSSGGNSAGAAAATGLTNSDNAAFSLLRGSIGTPDTQAQFFAASDLNASSSTTSSEEDDADTSALPVSPESVQDVWVEISQALGSDPLS